MKSQATHIEDDGTLWLYLGNQWYYWYHFEWSPYVGPVNKNFLLKLREINR